MKYLNITKEILNNLYIIQKKSIIKIAIEFNVNPKTISRYLKIFEIPIGRNINCKGKNNSFYGKHHTEEAKRKIRKFVVEHPNENFLNQQPRFGNEASNYRHGKYCTDNFCKCGEKISSIAIRCNLCKGIIHSDKIKGKNNPNWNEGSSFEPYSPLWTEELKIKIRQRDNHECQNCGMIQEEHFIVAGCDLNVHHIDYDKKNCKENNLITVCLSCNTRANFNREYWQEFYKIKTKEIKNGRL